MKLFTTHYLTYFMTNTILIFTAITTALIAGLFYSYSCSVVPGLGRLPDAEYLAAMQSINKAILNPVFFASFMGTLLLLPISTCLYYGRPVSTGFILLLIASVVYIIGVFGVTVMGNVPLNDALDQFNIHAATADALSAQRAAFEEKWNSLNNIRTGASIISLVLVLTVCIYCRRN